LSLTPIGHGKEHQPMASTSRPPSFVPGVTDVLDTSTGRTYGTQGPSLPPKPQEYQPQFLTQSRAAPFQAGRSSSNKQLKIGTLVSSFLNRFPSRGAFEAQYEGLQQGPRDVPTQAATVDPSQASSDPEVRFPSLASFEEKHHPTSSTEGLSTGSNKGKPGNTYSKLRREPVEKSQKDVPLQPRNPSSSGNSWSSSQGREGREGRGG
jgi:hypothetical protein